MAAEPGQAGGFAPRRLLRWESALVLLLMAVAVGGSMAEPGFRSGPDLLYLGMDGVWSGLSAVAVGGSMAEPGFLSGSNLFYLGLDVGEIALMTLPLTLVIVAGEIDLSIASILGLSSALIGYLWNAGWALEVIFPTVVLVG